MATPSRPRRGSYVEAARDRAEATRRLQEVGFHISWISHALHCCFTDVHPCDGFAAPLSRGALLPTMQVCSLAAGLHSRRITTTGDESAGGQKLKPVTVACRCRRRRRSGRKAWRVLSPPTAERGRCGDANPDSSW